MKKFWDLIIGFIFAVCFVIIGYPMGSEFWDNGIIGLALHLDWDYHFA